MNMPPAVGNVELNLDVLLTHIMHEVHPDAPDLDLPEPNTPEERELISTVIEPVVIQLLNNDIVPSLPTCTLPGQQGSASLNTEDEEIDTAEAISAVIKDQLENMELAEGVTIDEILDASMPAQEVIDQMDLQSPEGEAQMEALLE